MSVATHIRIEGGGGGTPLVLLHGVGLDLTMWDGVVDALAADRQVVRFDMLGHGRTLDPSGNRSFGTSWHSCSRWSTPWGLGGRTWQDSPWAGWSPSQLPRGTHPPSDGSPS